MSAHSQGLPAASRNQRDKRLTDNHGRQITYLRLAITDRCNLRCVYCMPEEGIEAVRHDETLSYEELGRLARLFLSMGIEKIRITGGEPFVRRGCIEFLERLKHEFGVRHLVVTTNGVETHQFLSRLQALPISGINLSLDTLDRERFRQLTRRDRLDDVLRTMSGALEHGIPLKVNSVVSGETSDEEILRLGRLAEANDLCLRFIEQMGFSGDHGPKARIDYHLEQRLARLFPGLRLLSHQPGTTAKLFMVPGFSGTLGIIEGHSRRFCSSCNRIRITPQGILKACLYDNGVLNLRELIRAGIDDGELEEQVRTCLNRRFANGVDTEQANHNSHTHPSMATIGG